MPATRYRPVLGNPAARSLLFMGFVMRIPTFGVAVVLTLHVVQTLHRSWSQAGLVAAVATLAIAISGPWRGRMLDRAGLRAVVAPSIILGLICWSIAPFAGYWVLLVLSGVAGLFAVPAFTIVRQGLIAVTDDHSRRPALSLDAVVAELSYMIGPILAISLTAIFPTAWVIFGLQMFSVVSAVGLWWLNPPIRKAIDIEEAADVVMPRRQWMTPRFFAVCVIGFASVMMLSGTEVAVVAAAKHFDVTGKVGIILAVWGLSSMLAGLWYGALSRPPKLFTLLVLMAVTTIAMGASFEPWSLTVLGFGAGIFVAPTMTSAFEALTRVVPEPARSEATGWNTSFQTTGGALGGPLAGAAIDAWGFRAGFVSVGAIGLLMALGGWIAMTARQRVTVTRSGSSRGN